MNRLHHLAVAASAAFALAAAGCATPAPTTGVPGAKPGSRSSRAVGQDQGGILADGTATVNNPGAIGPTGKPGKLLLAMYVIGSDLEDGEGQTPEGQLNLDGAATSDFTEIVDAVKALPAEQRANLEVLAVFGGARQTGWRGTKLIDLAGLLKDGEDGYYGNADAATYLMDTPGADMGDPATFAAFIGEVQKRRGDAAKVFLDIWDHGGSFAGMGPDTNTQKVLGNDQIKAVLGQAGFKADLIGFDACLMASVEVVQAVRGHADYLVASEELEPGHGWDYTTWLTQVAQKPDATSAEIGSWLVDAFIDSPKHKVTDGRTLSVVNLEKAGDLLAATDALGQALATAGGSGLDAVLDAHRGAQKYGSHGKDDDEFSRDLQVFAAKLGAQNPAVADATQAVIDGVSGCVVYAREDGTKPGSRGLSIYSFSNASWFADGTYNARTASGPGYYRFVEAVNGLRAGDGAAPTISGESADAAAAGAPAAGGEAPAEDGGEGGEDAEAFALVQADGDAGGIDDGDEGQAGEAGRVEDGADGGFYITVTDDVGVDDVDVVHVVQPDPAANVFEIVATEPAEEVTEGRFHVPAWDGETLHLVGADYKNLRIPYVVEEEEGALDVWSADCVWNGEDATLRMIVDADGAVVNTWVVPYEEDEDGTVLIQREQYELVEGDTLAFYRDVVDIDKDEERVEAGTPITLGATPAFSWEKVQGQGSYFAIAEDLKGNQQNSQVHLAE